MKKQELLHLHALLGEVQDHYEAETGYEIENQEYEELDVPPTSIHRSKTDHKDAVFALADGLVDEVSYGLDSELEETEPRYADDD